MAKRRVTNHTGRVSKKTGKPYDPHHNDRNFNYEEAIHIFNERVNENVNLRWTDSLTDEQKAKLSEFTKKNVSEMKNDDVEALFYKLMFTDWLNRQNGKHIASRHTERIKTMDEVRGNKNYCPEEAELKIGRMTDEQISPELYAECVSEYLEWFHETYKDNITVLDINTHADEKGGLHTHFRYVYHYEDEDGITCIGQEKALEKLGFELPIPEGTILTDESGNTLYEKDKEGNLKKDENGEPIPQRAKKSRFNNRKMPFSAQNREKWLDICEAHGIEVERNPDKKVLRGLELEDWIRKYGTVEKALEKAIEALAVQKEAITDEIVNKVSEQLSTGLTERVLNNFQVNAVRVDDILPDSAAMKDVEKLCDYLSAEELTEKKFGKEPQIIGSEVKLSPLKFKNAFRAEDLLNTLRKAVDFVKNYSMESMFKLLKKELITSVDKAVKEELDKPETKQNIKDLIARKSEEVIRDYKPAAPKKNRDEHDIG